MFDNLQSLALTQYFSECVVFRDASAFDDLGRPTHANWMEVENIGIDIQEKESDGLADEEAGRILVKKAVGYTSTIADIIPGDVVFNTKDEKTWFVKATFNQIDYMSLFLEEKEVELDGFQA